MSRMSKTIAILGVVAGLGVAALPLSTYAVEESQDTTVKLSITDKLSITVDGKSDDSAEVTLSATGAGTQSGLYSASPVTVNVISNNSKGYDLTIVGSTTGANVTDGVPADLDKTAMYNQFGDKISAGDVTSASASSWGYYVGDATAEGATPTWLAIPGTATPIASGELATPESGKDFKVSFGAYIKDGQAAGDYVGKVTFTATNK